MPYRSDASLWFNMPGVVAAFQPIGAPGPLLARYNQAHGGSGAYQAGGAALPAWAGHSGWTCTTTTYLESGVVATNLMSLAVHFVYTNVGNYAAVSGVTDTPTDVRLNLYPYYQGAAESYYRAGGAADAVTGGYLSGVALVTPQQGYRNGIAHGAPLSGAWTGTTTLTLPIGADRVDLSTTGCAVAIRAWLVCERTLSAAEAWHVSRQMAYCHVNLDWSAWGRRRRYYYAPPEAPPVTADDLTAAAARMGAFGPRLGAAARTGQQQAAPLPAAARAGHRSRLNG